jgi:hypothetical protein
MKVTIEIDSNSEMDKLYAFFNEFKLSKITVTPTNEALVTKGDKSINPDELFGIWVKKPRSLEHIRSTAWKKPFEEK